MDGLWGWCGIEMTELECHEAETAMANAMEAEAQFIQTGRDFCLAGQGRLYPCATHRDGDRIAALIGRPRWSDPRLEAMAVSQGHAAVCLSIWRGQGGFVFDQLAGHFALIILDQGQAMLAIDRMGVQPLCLARAGKGLVFASSAEAVAAHAMVGRSLDSQSLYHYFYFHDIPAPNTVFKNISKLLPAEEIHWQPGRLRNGFYWALRYQDHAPAAFNVMAENLRTTLRQAVLRQAPGDGVGAFLSGGTDSSSVAGYFRGIRQAPVPTYSIGFDVEGFDEMKYARIAARHFGLNNHEYYLKPSDVLEAIPLIARAYDEPFANESAVPAHFCARTAAADGIGIMLAGDGGDEIFGGNARYAKQMVFEHYGRVPLGLRHNVIEPLVFNFPLVDRIWFLHKLQSYIRQAQRPLPERLESYNFLLRQPLDEIFQPEFLAQIDIHGPEEQMREVYFRTHGDHPVQRMMHLDLKLTLADNDLRKVSRMAEIAGVEVRYPMLDDDLVALSGQLPPDYLLKGRYLRWFFKQALRDFLPREIISKSKHGFGLPFGVWALEDKALGERVDANLKGFETRGFLQASYVRNLRGQHTNSHASYFGKMIWVIVILEEWLSLRGL